MNPLLTRWVREHLISGKLAFEHPHSEGLGFLGKEEESFRPFRVILLLAPKYQSSFWVTYHLGWLFSGGSIRGEGVLLVQGCLGERGRLGGDGFGGVSRTRRSAASRNCLFPYFCTRAPWLALSPTFPARAVTG